MDVKFGTMNTRAILFVGGGAKNSTEWLAFIGNKVPPGVPESPYAIDFKSSIPDLSDMRLIDVPIYSCGDTLLGCSCGDYPSNAVCSDSEPPTPHSEDSCLIIARPFKVIFLLSFGTVEKTDLPLTNGEIHAEEYCAMYDICRKRSDGKVLNCPYRSPYVTPDELFSTKIQSLCPTITGNVCCTEAQFDTLREPVQQAMIEEKLSSGGKNMEQIEEIIGDASSNGREFLLGRMGHIKKRKGSTSESSSASTSKITNVSEDAIQQIKSAVREEVKNEVKEEMEKSMQAQLGAIIQRLSQKNPMLNLNLDGVLSSSDSDSLPSDVGED